MNTLSWEHLREKNLTPICRVCHCTEDHACVDNEGVPCCWVEPDLCSSCAEEIRL